MSLIFLVVLMAALPSAADMERPSGYPVGNFGISGEVTPHGKVLPRVQYNPPRLGVWLEELGKGQLEFASDGLTIKDSEFASKKVSRLYPKASVKYSDPRMKGLSITVDLLSPIRIRDIFTTSIPAICADITFHNESKSEKTITTDFSFQSGKFGSEISETSAEKLHLVGNGQIAIGFDSEIEWQKLNDGIQVNCSSVVPVGGSKKVRMIILCYDENGYYANKCSDINDLAMHVDSSWDRFRQDVDHFIASLPKTHDEQVNRYLHWYLQAALLLTRTTKDHVLNMGYSEFNQRDSYWTSWLQVAFWPELERRMIQESIDHQREDGKIPTTILPTIERNDDIDINEYFNLRLVRYYQWTHDPDFLKSVWPAYKKSVEYLKRTDRDGDGLLEQKSYWADWKDVYGVEGRKAAPHFELLWLAVLKEGQELAQIAGDDKTLAEYKALYEKSYKAINADVGDGGLWTGSFYTSSWFDGRADAHVQQDQVVGPLFGVVSPERVESIYASMEQNWTPWGVRDTYPYREDFGYNPGDYHNGGVWVYLNFVDAMSRFVNGLADEGFDIMRKVGYGDLEKFDDWMPGEYLDGNTGVNAGKTIQGWDANFYAAFVFGALGLKPVSATEIELMPRIPDSESFETPIVLHSGQLRLTQRSENGSLVVELTSRIGREMKVRYGAMTEKGIEGGSVCNIGNSRFCVIEFDLAPGETRELVFK